MRRRRGSGTIIAEGSTWAFRVGRKPSTYIGGFPTREAAAEAAVIYSSRPAPAPVVATRKSHKRRLRREGVEMACRVCGWRFPMPRNIHGEPPAIHGHHVIPVCKGGSDEVENIVLLCPNHHAIVHGIWGTTNYDGPDTPADLVGALREIDRVGAEVYLCRRLVERRGSILGPATDIPGGSLEVQGAPTTPGTPDRTP